MSNTLRHKVLIVARTRMGAYVCIGGFVYDTGEGVRLLTEEGENLPPDTEYQVGQVYQLEYWPEPRPRAPHLEDVRVLNSHYLGQQLQIAEFLKQRAKIWTGNWCNLFDGLLQLSPGKSAYISRRNGIPRNSTGFWQVDRELFRITEERRDRNYYWYADELKLKHVGFQDDLDILPAGTLLRVSLARWWIPDDEQTETRCYLQLSGWYL